MYNFCENCGSQLDQNTGLCPNCNGNQVINYNNNDAQNNMQNNVQNDMYNNVENNIQNAMQNGMYNNVQYNMQMDMQNNTGAYKKKRKKSLIILTVIVCILLLLGSFTTLDYFGVINTKVCESLGFKSSGSFTLESDKTIVYVGDSKEGHVTFFCKPEMKYDSIELCCEEKSISNEDFADDGNYQKNGDVTSSDGIFSTMDTITKDDDSKLSYYAIIKDGLKYYKSNTISLDVKESLSDGDISNIDNSQKDITKLISTEDYKNKTVDEKKEVVSNKLNELSNNNVIDKNSISFDENSQVYIYKYKSGTYGSVEISKVSNITYSNGDLSNDTTLNTYDKSTEDKSNKDNKNDNSKSSNAKATIVYDISSGNTDILNMYKETQSRWSKKGVDVDLISNPTLSDYSSKLSENSLVLFATRGSKITLPKSKIGNLNSYSVICTTEKVTADNMKKYKGDLGKNNIVCANTTSGTYYWILPSFFTDHYGNNGLKNSVMLFENAYGIADKGPVDFSLLTKSTGVVSALGFNDNVTIMSKYQDSATYPYITNDTRNYYMKRYGILLTETIAEEIINSSSVGDAVNYAKKIYGDTQYDYLSKNALTYTYVDKEVYPTLVGKKDSKISFTNVTNTVEINSLILKKDNYILESDYESITLKTSPLDKGQKIYDGENDGQILCDGKHIFFTKKLSEYETDINNEVHACYSMDLDGNNLKEEFSCNHSIDLITYKDGYLYYIDEELANGKLMKMSPSFDNKSEGSVNLATAFKAFALDNVIIYSNTLQISVDSIAGNTVCAYHMDTGKIEKLAYGYTIPYNCKTNNSVYLSSYKYDSKRNYYSSCKMQVVDKDGKITKNINLKDGYMICYVNPDDSYAIFRDLNAYKDRKKYDTLEYKYYKLDLKTEKITEIENDDNNYLDFIADKYNDDVYCKVMLPSGCASDVDGEMAKLQDNKLLPCLGDNSSTIHINSSFCAIIDGLYVDFRMDGEYPDETYEECVLALSRE